MTPNFTVADNFKILFRLSRSENWKKDVTIKVFLAINIISIISFIGILISDIIFYLSTQLNIDAFTWQLLIKILLVFSIFMFNKFQVNRILAKKLNRCTNQDFSYCNCEGYYLINRYINKQKLSRSYVINKILNMLLISAYLFLSVIPFIWRQNLSGDLLSIVYNYSIVFLSKLLIIDLLCSYIININIFGKESKYKINAELGNFINYLYIFIYLVFFGSILLLISYFAAFNQYSIFGIVSLEYATLFTIPIFYIGKFITVLIVMRKEKSKIKYLHAFIPIFVFPEKSIKE
ncbi:hypothetical protein DA803_00350 [[Mycoplasma] phocae]|uniref:Uncharacterized protein n=1 Tax=[Mycoplasma] phocae TaxID=142651 RepID=A0A2Z5IPY5_9BACT|nr:hypothetical protein [[Mycoplasma] phocae]AXE60552.1 hypothetical protein DA803_00350 [[Mycoplasma] phocae]